MRYGIVTALLAALALHAPAGGQTLEDYDYENLGFHGVGLELGGVRPARVESALFVGVRADLGYLGPYVRLVPGVSFWAAPLRQREVDELRANVLRLCREPESDCVRELGEIRVSDLTLNVDAHYTYDTGISLTPYTGLGIGLHLMNGEGELINDTFVEELLDAMTPAVNLVAGAELPLGPYFRLFGEARGVLGGDVRYAALGAGGSWYFVPSRDPGRAR